MRRAGLMAGLAALVAGVLAPSASADFHVMKIREIAGDTAGGNASYIELQMYAPGQTNLNGHKLTFWDTDAAVGVDPVPVGEIPLAGVPTTLNGQDQRTVLIGDTATAGRDVTAELSPFLENGPGTTIHGEGAVCFEAVPVDCVSWGAGFIGSNNLPDKATPIGTSLTTGLLAFRRTISGGCATLLEAGDDTNTFVDWETVGASPTPNSATPTETPCPAKNGGGTTKKKKCKKKGKGKAAAAAKKKKCKKRKK